MSKYKVGDKVRVREWEDMEKEFIKTTVGIISKNGCRFREDMKELCGKTYKIEGVWDETSNGIVRYKLAKCAWLLDDYMLENADFCLDDIREEMIVMLRSGEFYVSIGVRFINSEEYIPRCNYYKSMEHKTGNTLYDIVAVYKPSRMYGNGFDGMLTPNAEPIWKEKKHIEIPETERTILENIDKEYKWIVRDKEGDVYVCTQKPEKSISYWLWKGKTRELTIYNHLFKFLQWTDKEPVNFREALKGE